MAIFLKYHKKKQLADLYKIQNIKEMVKGKAGYMALDLKETSRKLKNILKNIPKYLAKHQLYLLILKSNNTCKKNIRI